MSGPISPQDVRQDERALEHAREAGLFASSCTNDPSRHFELSRNVKGTVSDVEFIAVL